MFALVLTVLAQTPLVPEPRPSCVEYEDDKPFHTCFDPLSGLDLNFAAEGRNLSFGPKFATGIGVRGTRRSHSKADTTWFNHHRLLQWTMSDENGANFDFIGYQTYWRRHTDDPSLVIQTSTPIRLPFPFDIGWSGSAFEWERRPSEGRGWVIRTGEFALLFDPIRSTTSQLQLGIGPEMAHVMRHDGVTLHHELSAFTSGEIDARFESDDGLWALFVHGVLGERFDPVTQGWALRGRGHLEVNRVLIAINEQPVRLYLRGEGAWHDAGADAHNEWVASLGIKVQLFSSRD